MVRQTKRALVAHAPSEMESLSVMGGKLCSYGVPILVYIPKGKVGGQENRCAWNGEADGEETERGHHVEVDVLFNASLLAQLLCRILNSLEN